MKTLSYIKGNLLRLTWICVLLLIYRFCPGADERLFKVWWWTRPTNHCQVQLYILLIKNLSVITDVDGLFKLDNVTPGDTLVVSYVSYKTFKQVIKKS